MINRIDDTLITRDLNCLWHPCSQMKDYLTFAPLNIASAQGCYLYTADGKAIIDAISSWWCKNLGHKHPRLKNALIKQAEHFEHVILANTTNDIIVNLSEQLTNLTQQLKKVFYACDGSSAIEIALKMAVQARMNKGQVQKTKIAALTNDYHGETLFALAVSDVGLFRKPFDAVLPATTFLTPIPYVSSRKDSLWYNCDEHWQLLASQLNAVAAELSVIIIEPILQGSGGMHVYSQDLLRRLRKWCTQNDVYLIIDEILTGFGRTGEMFAFQHANIEPDILCVGKGLTAGYLPMSAALVTNEIYDLFYDDYESQKAFLHSHTYSGHALAAAVALEHLAVIEEEDIINQAQQLEQKLLTGMLEVADATQQLTHIRNIGGMVAADLIPKGNLYKRLGYEVYQQAVKLGALLRPLGNTIYWLPPLNISDQDIIKLRDITIKAIIATQ